MDPATIIATVATVIKTAVDVGPSIIKGVEDATPFAQAIYDTLTGGTITQAQLDSLTAQIKVLSDQLQAPMDQEDGAPPAP